MTLREAHAQLTDLRARHAFRSGQSEELRALWLQIDEAAKQAVRAPDRVRWLWLSLEIAALLDFFQRQWEVLDELEKLDPGQRDRVVRKRARLLIQWGKDDGADTPKLTFPEFRKRAKRLAGEAVAENETSLFYGLFLYAGLPHLFPEFSRSGKYPEEMIALWDACLEWTSGAKMDEEQMVALIRKILAVEEQAQVALIYAFQVSLQIHIRRAANEAREDSAVSAPVAPGIPTPLALLQRMQRNFSVEQMGVAADYLTKKHWVEISCFPYPTDGPTKTLLAQLRYETLAGREKLVPAEVIQYLRLAICGFDFWRDKPELERILRQARQLMERAGVTDETDQPAWREVWGRLHYLAGEDEISARHFLKAAELEKAHPGKGPLTKAYHTFCPYELLDFENAPEDGPYSKRATETDLTALDRLGDDPYPGLIATASDKKYFLRYGETYIRTLRAHDAEAPVLFHIIDLDDAGREFFAQLASRFKGLFLSSERAAHPQPYYYASVRFLRAHDILERARRPVLFTDIDLQFRSSFRPIFAYGRQFDMMLRHHNRPCSPNVSHAAQLTRYPRLEPWDSITAGALLVTPNPQGLKMAAALSRMMQAFIARFSRQNATNWFIDQNMLYQFDRWLARHPEMKLGNLEDIELTFGRRSAYDIVASLGWDIGGIFNYATFGAPRRTAASVPPKP
jgi:hypothetical protein